MAKYRQIHVSYWQDSYILDLPTEEKFFYLYLMTNSKTTQCGIYELPLKVVEMETGLSSDRIFELLHKFVDYKKISFNEETREVMLLNWLKHNNLKSIKVLTCAIKELEDVKYIPFGYEFFRQCKLYEYPIDTVSIPYPKWYKPSQHPYGEEKEQKEEQEEEKKEEQEQMPAALRGNPHQRRISELVNKYNLECRGFSDLEKLEAYIGAVDFEVIEFAIKESENKSVPYATKILGRLVTEGKTTKDRIVIFPIKGGQNDAKYGTGHAGRTNAELDALSL